MTKRFEALLIVLDRGLAFVLNRILSFLIGLLPAALFAVLCFAITDIMASASGVAFWTVWKNLGAHATPNRFFEALDHCGLAQAWLNRVDIITIVSLLFGFSIGNQFRKTRIGFYPNIRERRIALLLMTTLALAAVLVATLFVAALHPSDNSDAVLCVQELRLQLPF